MKLEDKLIENERFTGIRRGKGSKMKCFKPQKKINSQL